MSWFKKKPTESQMSRAIMFGALSARETIEREHSRLATSEEIAGVLEHMYDELSVRPDKDQKTMARIGVNALLGDDDFLDELKKFIHSNPGVPPSPFFLPQMRDVLQKSVDEFMKSR